MKLRGIKKHGLWVVSAVFLVLMMNVVFAADPVVIFQTGFEDGERRGQIMPVPTGATPYGEFTSEDQHSGAKSLKMYPAGNWGVALTEFNTIRGEIITIKFWSKSEYGARLGFHGVYGISGWFSFPASSDWTEHTYNLDTTTGNYGTLGILIYGSGTSTGGLTYLDDFLITRPIPTPTPTPVVIATVTPTPTGNPTVTPTPTPGRVCSVAYMIQSDWGNGATVNVTIKNDGASAINGWTLAFAFQGNQTITNLWNGIFTQNGTSVSVKDAGYNATIPANGGSVNFGFNLNYSGTNAKPTGFTLNGTACQTQ